MSQFDNDVDTTNLQGGPDLDTVRAENKGEPNNPRLADERPGAPFPTEPPDPSADDPYIAGAPEEPGGVEVDQTKIEGLDEGPSYERDQGLGEDTTGGSTDPTNTRSHADSGRPE